MKIPTILPFCAATAIGGLLFTACDDYDREETEGADSATTQTATPERTGDETVDIEASAKEFWQDLESYTHAQQDDLVDGFQVASRELQEEYREVSADLSEMTSAAGVRLRKASADFATAMARLQNASAEQWEEARKNAGEAWESLKAAYEAGKKEMVDNDEKQE